MEEEAGLWKGLLGREINRGSISNSPYNIYAVCLKFGGPAGIKLG